MRIRELSHSVYQTAYHIVWGTKYRRKFIKDYVKVELVKSLYKILKRFPSWYILKINTDVDHVHLLIEFPPTYSISSVVRELKTYTSIDLRKRFPFIRKMYDGGTLWSCGYFVSTVGINEDLIKKYIDRQNTKDRGIDISSEFS